LFRCEKRKIFSPYLKCWRFILLFYSFWVRSAMGICPREKIISGRPKTWEGQILVRNMFHPGIGAEAWG
jgi:hypothetical protein